MKRERDSHYQIGLARAFGILEDDRFDKREKRDNSIDGIWRIKPPSVSDFFGTFSSNINEAWFYEPFYPLQQYFVEKLVGENPYIWDRKFKEGHAFWGKGSGKDKTIAKLFNYIVVKLLCMKNPQQGLEQFVGSGTIGDSHIDIANVSKDSNQARDVFFKYFKAIAKKVVNPNTGNNFFEEMGVDLREGGKNVQATELNFPHGITCHSLNSKQYAGEGLNLFFVAADEIGASPISRIKGQLTSIRETVDSRFPDGIGKLVLMSYKYDQDCAMSMEFKIGKSDPEILSSRAATWIVNPKKKKSSYKKHYMRDPRKAAWTYECKETGEGHSGFIRQKFIIPWCFNNEVGYNPFVGNVTSTSNILGVKFKDAFYQGLKDKNKIHAIHVDLAKGKADTGGDCAGIAMTHPEMLVQRIHPKSIDVLKTLGFKIDFNKKVIRKGVVVDFMLQLKVDPSTEIQFSDIISFILGLKNSGVKIFKVSYDGWNCCVGSTKIKLLNGKNIKIKDLVGKNNFWVYSYDLYFKKIVPGLVKGVRKTGRKVVYRITLDNGKSEEFSGDHPFLMRDGNYKCVKDLKVGDSLMPLYYNRKGFNGVCDLYKGYEKVMHPETKKWQLTHNMVMENLIGVMQPELENNFNKKGWVVHHKNKDKLNNDPENLILMSKEDHYKIHKEEWIKNLSEWWDNPENLKIIGEKSKNNWKNEEYRKKVTLKIKEKMTKINKMPYKKELARLGALKQWKSGSMKNVSKKNKKSIKKLWENEEYRKKQSLAHKGNKGYWLGKKRYKETILKVSKAKKGKKYNLRRRTEFIFKINKGKLTYKESLEKAIFNMKRDKNKCKEKNNHKILKIEKIGIKEVYDMEVDQYHNFALSSGIFVHNSVGEIQRLNSSGVNAEELSVDKKTDPYDTVKDLLYLGLLRGYENPIAIRELKELKKIDGKIDHPEMSWERLETEGLEHGSKDVSDGLAGSVFTSMKEINMNSGICF